MIPPEALRVCPDSSPKPKTFDEILAESELPPPGPELYAARRRLWLTPRPEVAPTRLNVQSSSSPPSSSHRRLEILLSSPNAIQNEEVWNGGIQGVWKVLNGGRHFRRRLPMALLIKIVHSAWLRDETWPVGAIAPEPDDILPNSLPPSASH